MATTRNIETFNRIAAVSLLSSYAMGFETTWGKIFIVIMICSILLSAFFIVRLIAKKESFGSFLLGECEPVFWPGIILLWTVIAHIKEKPVVPGLVLLLVVIILESSLMFISKKKK